MAERALAEPYADLEQQREAAHLGMWIFLATEVLFFGGLIAAYTAYRFLYPKAFAEAGGHMSFWLGSLNTAVLLTSSLAMAFSVEAAKVGARKRLTFLLLLTAGLGVVFLGLKALEYRQHIEEHLLPGRGFRYAGVDPERAQMFFYLYFALTGLHGLHVTIGVAVLAAVAAAAWRRKFTASYHTPVAVAGLYWHFVDIVWIFLYPLLYQVPR